MFKIGSIKIIASLVLLAGTLFISTPMPQDVSAQGLQGASEVLRRSGEKAYGESAVSGASLENTVGVIIQTALSLLGILFLALTVYGGYLWMNARGNEQQVEKAKSLITQAVIGLAIALAGYIITDFVVSALIGATTGVTE